MAINTGDLNKLVDEKVTSLGNDILAAILHSAEDLMTGQGWLEGINKLLAELGKTTAVSRVWIFQTLDVQKDFIVQDYAFEWYSDKKYKQIGLPHFNHFKSPLIEPEYISLIKSRQKGEYQSVVTEKLPDAWLKNHLRSQKIKSMLTIPIIIENQWWGTLGLDDCEREYSWSANDITLLRTASYFISSAIVRDNHRAKQHQLDILKENISCSSWELDSRRGHFWCTSEVLNPNDKLASRQLFTFKQWLKRIHPEHRKPFLKTAKDFLTSSTPTLRYDLKIMRSDGEYRWIEVSCNAIKNETKLNHTIAGIYWDITQRKIDAERLLLEATTDSLTGLMNRRKFQEIIKAQFEQFSRDQQPFTLAMLDIDFFKKINDQYGHNVGDSVLTHFAQLCSQLIRPPNVLARIGGEEFAIVMPDTNQRIAQNQLETLCRQVHQIPFIYQGKSIKYSVSIGFTIIEDTSTQANDAFDAADRALYHAKQTGRNKVMLG